MTKPLFLKWSLINVLAVLGAATGAVVFTSKVGTVGTTTKLAAGLIVIVYALMSAYCGKLMWRLDWVFGNDGPQAEDGLWRKKIVQRIIHDSEHVYFSISLLQILGLLGTVAGFLVIMVGGFSKLTSTDAEAVRGLLQHVASGSATALLATLVGILTSIVLGIQHHLLMDAIERDATDTR